MKTASIPFRTAAISVVLAAGAASAGERTFQVPEGCTANYTAQLRDCQVVHNYSCQGEAQGDQWSAYVDGEGPYYVSKIDYETRWVESYDLYTGEVETIGEETDPASFSTLLQSGRDDFDFTTVSNSGEVVRFKGYDQLTGETATIDGVTLDRTTFDLAAYAADGTMLWRRQGGQFIHRDWRVFFSDREEFTTVDGEVIPTVDTPVEFAFPGDKDFLAMEPKYDCDVVTAALRQSVPVPEGP